MGLAAGVVILARGLNVSSKSCPYFIVNLFATKRAPGLPTFVDAAGGLCTSHSSVVEFCSTAQGMFALVMLFPLLEVIVTARSITGRPRTEKTLDSNPAKLRSRSSHSKSPAIYSRVGSTLSTLDGLPLRANQRSVHMAQDVR
ncbi:hypothetical protein TSUD_370520 [Trifolium subterraneum]|uniref:Uncharacterized protein n=1 Tax=Trifolium subterraneum TaxID=3900 RepID=A0A2Z6MNW6_TRISU|nr:hypothetical protein TSUD_370520 [Trifolium subterraneum]